MRLKDKVAIIIGAGQSEGSTTAVGNGRATALVFAREGAKVLVVDRDITSSTETVTRIAQEGGEATACQADVVDEQQVKAAIDTCVQRWDGSTSCITMSALVSPARMRPWRTSPPRPSIASSPSTCAA